MKKINALHKIKTALVFIGLFSAFSSFATIYTASVSGNWSNPTTWVGGVAPSFNISADNVIIPNGLVVTLDNNATFISALSSLDVEGTLTSNSGTSLSVGSLATLTGGTVANINVGTLNFQSGSTITFPGIVTTDTFINAVANLQLVAMVTVANTLNLAAGTLNVYTAGGLTLGAGANIIVSGGLLAVNGGTLGLTSTYNVTYIMSSAIAGPELGGAGLNNITIAVPAGNTVTMASDLSINGILALDSGSFVIGPNTLTINGAVATGGSGTIQSSALSNINITTPGGITGPLNFGDSSTVLNFTLNTGANSQAHIGGNLTIVGILNLVTGTLSFDSINLVIGGISGSGMLNGDSLSNLTVSSLTTLSFAPGGQKVNNLTISTGFGGSVTLATNLAVYGMLNLVGPASLNISGDSLIIYGNAIGQGTLVTDNNTMLSYNTNEDIISPINVIGSTLGALSINIGPGHTVGVNRNMTISSQLNLQSGIMNVGPLALTVSGVVTGTGTISTSSSSIVTINSASGSVGALNFASGSALRNLVINTGIGSQAFIGGQLDIMDTLALTSGTLNIGNASLTISGITTGSGGFSGTDSSDLIINTPGGLSNLINFASGGQVLNNLTINVDPDSSVTIGTMLTIKGTLSLSSASQLDISQDSLILRGNMTGAGQLVVNTATVLIISTNNSLNSQVNLSGPIGTFELNSGAEDSVVLGSDLNVTNILSLQNGLLILNNHNLGVTGNIEAGGNANISSNSMSNIRINTTGSLSGGLSFTEGANTVNNFWLHATGSLALGSNLTVDSSLVLSVGTINIGNDTLVIANGGSITGADSTAYVIAGGSGALGLYLTQGNTAWVNFAVGTSSNYTPVAMQLNAGSDGGIVYASVDSGVLAQGTTGTSLSASHRLVNVTWMVEPSFTSNVNVNLTTTWPSAVEVNGFNTDSAYISHYTNGAWDQSAYVAATLQASGYFSLQRNGITSFSPFTVFGTPEDTTTITTSINLTDDRNFEIYPNPATNNLVIKNIAGTDNINIDIVNVTGQVVASYKLTDYTTNVSLSALDAGNYLIKLYNSNMTVVKPFIKM